VHYATTQTAQVNPLNHTYPHNMVRKLQTESDKQRFIRIARELGCEETDSDEKFLNALKKILGAKPLAKKQRKKG